jgi:hypothetical protein
MGINMSESVLTPLFTDLREWFSYQMQGCRDILIKKYGIEEDEATVLVASLLLDQSVAAYVGVANAYGRDADSKRLMKEMITIIRARTGIPIEAGWE